VSLRIRNPFHDAEIKIYEDGRVFLRLKADVSSTRIEPARVIFTVIKASELLKADCIEVAPVKAKEA